LDDTQLLGVLLAEVGRSGRIIISNLVTTVVTPWKWPEPRCAPSKVWTIGPARATVAVNVGG